MKRSLFSRRPHRMVHVTDPLVKSQLFNIWVLASEVVITAVIADGWKLERRTWILSPLKGAVDNDRPWWGVGSSDEPAFYHSSFSVQPTLLEKIDGFIYKSWSCLEWLQTFLNMLEYNVIVSFSVIFLLQCCWHYNQSSWQLLKKFLEDMTYVDV